MIAPDSDARCELKVGAVFQVGPKGGVVSADGIDIGQCMIKRPMNKRIKPIYNNFRIFCHSPINPLKH